MRIAVKLALSLMLGIVMVLVLNGFLRSADPDLFDPVREQATRFAELKLAGILLAITSLITGAICVLLIGRPINQLRDQVRTVGAGSMLTHPALEATDEIGDLALEVNHMFHEVQASRIRFAEEAAARLDALEGLRHTERLAVAGKLASIVAHELGTPLNVIHARATMIAVGDSKGQEAIDCARIIVEQSGRMSGIIKGVLDSVRKGKPVRRLIGLRVLLHQATGLVSRLAEKQQVTIELGGELDGHEVEVDSSRIVQVLTNLITNGIQAMPKGGRIQISASKVASSPDEHRAPDGYWTISVRDNGVGISAEALKIIFKPFYTTKGDQQGTGLGLAVADGIVREHGGWIDVESEIDIGSCFKICLPAGG